MTKKIAKVMFVKETDCDPDLSYIGEYTDKPGPWVIVRRDGGYLHNLQENSEEWNYPNFEREYRFFKPYAGEEKEGTPDYQKYGLQDFARMEAYNRGDWGMLFAYVEAQITVNGTIQRIRSSGCGGLESDGGDHSDIKSDELAQLRNILLDMGFSELEIDEAFKEVKDKDR